MTLHRTLLAGAAVLALSAVGAQAADFMGGVDPIYDSGLFNFEGFYVGATAGIGAFPVTGTVGTVGLVAGANFALSEAFLAGLEFQADALWNGGGFVGLNGLLMGKVGGYLSDDMVVYGTLGTGWVANVPSYALGGGIEMAVADQISVRGEALATGSWGGWVNGGKATVGVLWHMN